MLSKELEKTLHDLFATSRQERRASISVEHLLQALLNNPSALDLLRGCGVDVKKLGVELSIHLTETDSSEQGDDPVDSQPTPGFQRVLQRAMFQKQGSSTHKETLGAHVLIAIFSEKDSIAAIHLHRQGISRLDALNYFVHGTRKFRKDEVEKEVETAGGRDAHASISHGKGSALALFARNLNKMAAEGHIDPLVGREDEIQRVVQILCRRRKNNPLLVGEPGVGKTAIAEGLAWRILEDDVPEPLIGSVIFSLDLGALVAGTKFRGDIEIRLKDMLRQLATLPKAILFIDEIHTIIGAGSAGGVAMDVANLLKPALSNGQLRCIGAATFSEYRTVFSKDFALARRFHKIDVSEPTADETVKILRGLKSRLEEHHEVQYSDDALVAAVDLSKRFIADRQLPDKALDVLDEAGAAQRLGAKSERKVIITRSEIESIISKMTGSPPQTIDSADRAKLATLERDLGSVVFGQNTAVSALSDAIKLSRAGLKAKHLPTGSFLFSGPTGVGKTEVAKQLALLIGVKFIRFDMSEYMERHAVSRLIGVPPGHKGFTQGGLLTEAIAKNPYSVLLLDEIEKAHPDIFSLLLQVMDYGILTDSSGRKTDFSNVIIIMTTNAGAERLSRRSIGFTETKASGDESVELKRMFSPEFRNRIDAIISFGSLGENVILQVTDKFLLELEVQLAEKHVDVTFTDALRTHLCATGFDPVLGARPMLQLIKGMIIAPLSDELLFGRLVNGGSLTVDYGTDGVVLSISGNAVHPSTLIAALDEE